MSTVESIVAQIGADVRQYTAGMRKAADDTEQFLTQIQRSANRVKFVDESQALAQSRRAASLVTASFHDEFERSSADMREALFRGALSPAEFRAQGQAAAKAYNDAVITRIKALSEQGELTEPLHRALVASLKDAGLEASNAASRAAAAHPLLGNLSTQGQRAAQSLLTGLDREFTNRMTDLREKFGRGLISREQFTRQGHDAGAAFNAGIATGLDTLQDRGQLTGNIRRALVESMKDAGDQAGDEYGRGLIASLMRVAGPAGTLGRQMQQIGTGMLAGITAPILALGGFGVKAASDAAESMSKMEAVFGESAGRMNETLRGLMSSVPETLPHLQDATSDVFSLIAGFGAAVGPARDFSTAVVRLAADLSSMRNIRFDEALVAIEAGLRGESKPVARFGADVRVAALDAEALRSGIKKVGETLDPVGRAQAAFNIMVRAMGPALGDAARTSGSAANQFRFLRRDLSVAAEAIGDQLLPVVVPMVSALANLARSVATLHPQLLRAAIALAAFAAVVGPVLIGVGSLIRLMSLLGTAFKLAAAAEGLGALVAGIGVLAGVLTGVGLVAAIAGLVYWVTRTGGAAQGAQGAIDAYGASLVGMSQKQLEASRAELQRTADFLNAEKQRLTVELAGRKATEGATAKPSREQQSLIDRLALLNQYTGENTAKLVANGRAMEESAKRAAAMTDEMAQLQKSMGNALGGIGTPGKGQKTALQLMADDAKSVVEWVQSIRATTNDAGAANAKLLATWDIIAATVARIGPSTAKGANELRGVMQQLATDPVIQFFRSDWTPKLDLTDFDRSFSDAGERVRRMFENVKVTADFDLRSLDPGTSGDLARKIIDAHRTALQQETLGLKVAENIQVTLDTSGVSGGVSKLALLAGQASDRMLKLSRSLEAWGPLAGLARAVSGGLESLSTVLAGAAVTLANPMQILRAGVSGLADAVALTARGIFAAATSIGRAVLSALNPLNIFATFAQKIGTALSPALNALEGPLTRLATTVADALTPVFEALGPVVDALIPVIRELFNAIGPVLVALAPLLKIVAQLLEAAMPIIRALTIAFTYLGQVVLVIGAALLRLAGNLIIGFGKVIEVIARAIDKLPGISAKGAISFAQDIQKMGKGMLGVSDTMRDGAKALGVARDQIRSGNYMDLADGASAATDSLGDLSRTATDVGDALRNVPEGFKVALSRWRVALPEIAALSPGLTGATGPTGGVNQPAPVGPLGNITLNMANVTIQADSETTATRVVADLVGQAEVQAAAATGRSVNFAQFLPSVVRNAARASALRR